MSWVEFHHVERRKSGKCGVDKYWFTVTIPGREWEDIDGETHPRVVYFYTYQDAAAYVNPPIRFDGVTDPEELIYLATAVMSNRDRIKTIIAEKRTPDNKYGCNHFSK